MVTDAAHDGKFPAAPGIYPTQHARNECPCLPLPEPFLVQRRKINSRKREDKQPVKIVLPAASAMALQGRRDGFTPAQQESLSVTSTGPPYAPRRHERSVRRLLFGILRFRWDLEAVGIGY